MRTSFQAKVAPPILRVLDVLARIEASRGREPEARDEVRRGAMRCLGAFDESGADARANRLAKQALIYWIDEVLVTSEWFLAKEWSNNSLERELLGTRNRSARFFEDADEARGLQRTDAFEVFAICSALGFEGVYRSKSAEVPAGVAVNAAPPCDPPQSRATIPESLQLWTGAALSELCSDPLAPFEPRRPLGAAGTARPPLSRRTVSGMLTVTLFAALTLTVLWVIGS